MLARPLTRFFNRITIPGTITTLTTRVNAVNMSLAAALVLVTASWRFILTDEGSSILSLFSAATFQQAGEFLVNLLGIGNPDSALLNPVKWRNALVLSYQTLQMSVMAIGFAGIGMLLTVIPAARTAADGSLTLARIRLLGVVLFVLLRGLYIFSRAVPELIWAMLIIFVFQPGILPGAVALGLHNFGILGKLCTEVVEDLDRKPLVALSSSGASTAQMLLYGVLPQVTPKFLTYLLYRWEVIIRTTIVVGFVGAGGLGQQFRLSMSWFHFTEVTLLLIFYVLLVFLVDLVSILLRRIVQ